MKLTVLAAGAWGTALAIAFSAVSYTHLDVYKRQHDDGAFVVLQGAGNNF